MASVTRPSHYIAETTNYRNFWFALAGVDLRNRFRRTSLGVIWLIVHPLAFTLILSVMFHFLFNQPLPYFSVYVFSGVIFWSWFTESFQLGAGSLLVAGMFIRQKNLPLIGYAVRTSIVSISTYLLSFVGLLAWTMLMGFWPGWMWLLLPINILLLASTMLPIIVISGLLGVMYRDYQQAIQIVLQALWFLSPVFMDKTIFARPHLRYWDAYNPISNMLALIRQPLMEYAFPSFHNYLIVTLSACALYYCAYLLLRRHERHIVYYL